MVDSGSPFMTWVILLPSRVITDLTLVPSPRSSSNSSPNLNLMVVVFSIVAVVMVYSSLLETTLIRSHVTLNISPSMLPILGDLDDGSCAVSQLPHDESHFCITREKHFYLIFKKGSVRVPTNFWITAKTLTIRAASPSNKILHVFGYSTYLLIVIHLAHIKQKSKTNTIAYYCVSRKFKNHITFNWIKSRRQLSTGKNVSSDTVHQQDQSKGYVSMK